tara:strand:- start:167053 stop:167424 length:372 start_codon:yes stop_codon:yes gene_type:complete
MATVKVLIADDDALMVRLLSHKLSQKGLQVISAEDGEQALAMIGVEMPDIVILDGMMPGMDGVEVLKRLKQDAATRDIPVLLLSARKMEADVVAGLEHGAEDYMVKPFMPEELWARIRKILSL